jgi:hypothetical protein
MGRNARNSIRGFASPACSMGEAGDIYMGYADRDEILATLNGLLEASRAGARAALATIPQAPTGPALALLDEVQADETEACAMLLGHIRALEGAPSPHIGAAYAKAMMLHDADERIAFLNRERGQIIGALRKLLPRVRDMELHGDLASLLHTLEAHMERAKAALSRERFHRKARR